MPMVKGLTERNPSGCAIFSSDSIHDIVLNQPCRVYRASAVTALLHSKLVRRALGPIAMEFLMSHNGVFFLVYATDLDQRPRQTADSLN